MHAWLRSRGPLLAAIILIGVTAAPTPAQTRTKNVLIISGGPEEFPGNPNFDATLRKVLFSHTDLQIAAYSEYLENEEFGDAAYTSLADYIRLKFHTLRLDLVVANTAPALQFVLRYRDALFPDVPVLFGAAGPPPEVLRGEIAGVTGILREPSQAETLELALKIHPATKRLHIIAYAPAVDGFEERIRSTLAAVPKSVTLTFAHESSLPEMLATVQTLPADSIIFYVRYSPVTQGRVIFPDELLPEIAAMAPVPIYSSLDTNIGKGVVGGMMRSGINDATRLGDMSVRILEGAPPASMPMSPATVRPIFDWNQLQRWRIDESRLPPDSEIRFRVPTVWELYGSYIVATFLVVAAQLVTIAVLLGQRARLQSAKNEIRSRETLLRTSYDRIRQMAGGLINAQETARAEIARDLHDDVSQKLAYVSMGVNSLKTATGNLQDPETQQAIEALEREAKSTFDGIRRLSHELHPATLRLLGLAPALRSHCAEVAKRQEVTVNFSAAANIGTVDPTVAVCFFRIAQESLRNSIVHGGAKHLTVTLNRSGDELELVVTDDGLGFDVSAVKNNGGGLGLVTMEERINLAGGNLAIVSEVGHGTTIQVRGPAAPVQ
jgi:signal transduction histidine kinase